jgi:hypothetical protein
MKRYFCLVALLVFVIVGCNSSNSNKTKHINYTLNGDFLTLEFLCDSTDTLDAYGFAGPYLKNIYLHQYNGECRATLIFNNNHVEEYNVTEKTDEKTVLKLRTDDGKYVHIDKVNQVVSYFSHHNSYTRTETSGAYYLVGCGDYKVTSVEQLELLPSKTAPSYNDIFEYRLNGEARGRVKKITTSFHARKKMFGQDTLLASRDVVREYNRAGKIVYCDDETKFDFRFTYDENNRLIQRDYNRYTVKYEGKPEEGMSKMYTNKEYLISYYGEDLMLKNQDRYVLNEYTNKYYLDEKIVYNGRTSIVYNSDGKERYKNKYDENMSLMNGYVTMNDLFLGNYDVYGGEYNMGGRDELRHCVVTNYGSTTNISFSYPFSRPRTDSEFTYDDEITYDVNCNPTKRVVRYYDGYNKEFTTDTYIMLYQYDEHNNWIARHEILVSHKKGSYQASPNIEAHVEYREIEYYE